MAAGWTQGPLGLGVSAAVTAAGLGACGAARNVLGTNTGPCFLALPTARRAVEGRGSLAGIRLVDVAKLTPGDRAVRALLDQLPVPPPREVCLVAYAGSFTLGHVEQPVGLPPPPAGVGPYAIAVGTTPDSRLVGTFVGRGLPRAFARAHVGF